MVQGELVYEFKRVRLVSGRPLLRLDAYFPLTIGRKIARRDFHGELIVPMLREIVPSKLREEYPVVFFRENFRADQYFYTIKLSQS